MIIRKILVVLILLIASNHQALACTFTEYNIDLALSGAFGPLAVDLDNDADIDVVAVGQGGTGTIKWYQNNGSQSFTGINISTTYTAPWTKPYAVDIDADGDMDILSAATGLNDLTLWRSNGAATPIFTKVNIDVNLGAAKEAAAADFDGDGDLDIVAAGSNANIVGWYKQDASHNFGARTNIGSTTGPVEVEVTDLDDDGDIDVVFGAFGSDGVYWLKNNGAGIFTQITIYGSLLLEDLVGIDVADLDGDGDKDIVGAASASGNIMKILNDGNENFTASIVASTTSAWGVEAADLDNDGDIDLVASLNNGVTGTLKWWRNNGSGAFAETSTAVITSSFSGARYIHTKDIDRDGLMDIVGAAVTAGDIKWWKNTCSPTRNNNKLYFAP